jgi:hypothetical protein
MPHAVAPDLLTAAPQVAALLVVTQPANNVPLVRLVTEWLGAVRAQVAQADGTAEDVAQTCPLCLGRTEIARWAMEDEHGTPH